MPSKRVKVLQIIKGLDIGGVNGGAERFSVDLARALPRDRFEVSICAFFEQSTVVERDWRKQLEDEGFPVFFVSSWAGNNAFGSYLHGLSNLHARLRAGKLDICHSHFQLGTIAAMTLVLCGLAKRAVRTAHITREWESGLYGWSRQQIFSKWLFPLLLDAEVGVSSDIAEELCNHPGARLFRTHTACIYNAIALDNAFYPAGSAPATRPDGRQVIGVVGRLMPQKGHTYLIRALPKVLETIPNMECWVIGDGELRQILEEEAKQLGVAENIIFMGKRANVADLMRSMDLFVLPSLWEGLPTVVMEAMACGTPVLATNISGTREMIQHGVTGWLAPPENPQMLANEIISALGDADARARVANTALNFVERFSIRTVSEQYQELYLRLLER